MTQKETALLLPYSPLPATRSKSSDLGKRGDLVRRVPEPLVWASEKGPYFSAPWIWGSVNQKGLVLCFLLGPLKEKLSQCTLHYGSCRKDYMVSGPEAFPPE